MDILILVGLFFLLMFLGFPIVFALGLSSTIFILFGPSSVPLELIPQRMLWGTVNYTLIAVPLFFLGGELMNAGGITNKMVDVSNSLIGHIKGGLANVNIVANMIMAGVSGAAVVDAAMIGTIMIPSMKKEGYSAEFSSAVTAAAATIGPIIPPSIPLVIYGALCNVSIGRLFLGGAIPGILMGIYLMIATYFISKKRNYPSGRRFSWKERAKVLWKGFFSLIAPIIIVGGIVSGVVTATESGIILVIYTFLIGFFVFRELPMRDIPIMLKRVAVSSATVIIIIATSSIFSYLLANMRADQQLVEFLTKFSVNKWLFLLIINIFFLIWGCFLEAMPALVILMPILAPVAKQIGVDPVHFGVVCVLNLMIGMITPPFGILLFVLSSLGNVSVKKIVKEIPWLMAALIACLLTITYTPSLVTWLPNVLMGK
jgi:C4-dicarboxylate transporter DctM subunit